MLPIASAAKSSAVGKKIIHFVIKPPTEPTTKTTTAAKTKLPQV